MFNQFKTLIIHSNKSVNDQIKTYLNEKNYICNQVLTYKDIKEYYDNHTYDCIIIEDTFPRIKIKDFLVKTKTCESTYYYCY